ncbi:hypothetical protein EAF04_010651 [Stromatinia cepivora]|nr:hypothetical protein EAF04_010651 [Stromatinia cepivora]
MTTERSDSRGSDLGLVAWVTTVAMFFAVSVRIGTRIGVMRHLWLSLDGILIFVAMLFAVGQTGALSVAINNGLGEDVSSLKESQVLDYERSIYGAYIMFILSLCFSKLSIVIFFMQSTIGKQPKLACGVLMALIILWTLVSVFALVFQCSLPQPWMFLNNSCSNRIVFWYFIEVFDIITDTLTMLLPFYTLRFLQLNRKTRYEILGPFMSRILIIPLTVLHLIYLSSSLASPNPTLKTFNSTLLSTLQMNFAIIISCFPFSRLLITSVQSGLLTTSLRDHAPNYEGGTNNIFTLTRTSTKNASRNKSVKPMQIPRGWRNVASATMVSKGSTGNEVRSNRRERRGSPTKSEQHIIMATTEWAVDHHEITIVTNE